MDCNRHEEDADNCDDQKYLDEGGSPTVSIPRHTDFDLAPFAQI